MAHRSIIKAVTLRVADLERSVHFYEVVVGLKTLASAGAQARLGIGDEELLILQESPRAPRRARDEAGLFHIAFRVPDRPALADALRRIQRRHRFTGASDHKISHALYLDDPDQNGLEIYYDRPRNEWPIDAQGHIALATKRLDLQKLLDTEPSAEPDHFPAGTDVGHVHLEVVDLHRAHQFYVQLLGLGVKVDTSSVLFVAAHDYHHHIGLNRWNDRQRPRRESSLGLVSVELALPDQTVERLYAEAPKLGIEIHRNNGGVQLQDPNNLRWIIG